MKYKTYAKKKKKLKTKVHLVLFSILLVLCLIVSAIALLSLDYGNDENIIYESTVNKNIDYKVTLKDKGLGGSYEDDLGMNLTYPSANVDKIVGTMEFDYKGSSVIDIIYEYDLKAIITADYRSNEEDANDRLWTKEWELSPLKTSAINNQDKFSISEEFEIDYDFYDGEANKFRKTLNIPANIDLEIIMNVSIKKYINGEIYQKKEKISMNLPLTKDAFKISEDYEKELRTIDKKEEATTDFLYRKRFIFTIALLPFEFYLVVKIIKDINKLRFVNNYTKNLKKILKEYGDVIVEVHNPAIELGVDVIYVKSFNEMMDLEEELRIPIMFYETKEGLEGEFSLVHANLIYKYILDNEVE